MAKSLIIGFTLLALELTWFMAEMGYITLPMLTSKAAVQGEQIATIVERKNRLLWKSGDNLAWQDVGKKSPVFNSDMLLTLEDSRGEIEFDDTTRLVIAENTLISLQKQTVRGDFSAKIKLDLVKGNVRAVIKKAVRSPIVAKKKGEAESTQMKEEVKEATKVAIVLPDNSEITADTANEDISLVIEKPKDSTKTSVSVEQGEVTFKKADEPQEQEIKVNESKQLIIDEKEKKVETRVVSVKLLKPASGSVSYVDRGVMTNIIFAWVPADSDQKLDSKIELIVSRDSDFDEILGRIDCSASCEMPLVPGKYYWKIEGPDIAAAFASFEIREIGDLNVMFPSANESIIGSEMEIAVKALKSAANYKYFLARQGDKEQVFNSDYPFYKITNATEGSYIISAAALDADGNTVAKSPAVPFSIVKPAELPPPPELEDAVIEVEQGKSR